jgi:hypothetical protein
LKELFTFFVLCRPQLPACDCHYFSEA